MGDATRILVITGFSKADLEAEAARVEINGFLEKPFALEDLPITAKSARADSTEHEF